MGQHEVLEFLEQNPNKKYTTLEIAEKLNVKVNSVARACLRLRTTNFINYEVCMKLGRMKYYYWVEK